MRHPMVVQVRAGREPFPAVLALVRLLSRVYPSVGVQAAGCAETFIADHAHVRFLAWNKKLDE